MALASVDFMRVADDDRDLRTTQLRCYLLPAIQHEIRYQHDALDWGYSHALQSSMVNYLIAWKALVHVSLLKAGIVIARC